MFDASIMTERLKEQATVEVVRDPNQPNIVVEVIQSKRGTVTAKAIVKSTAEWEAASDYVPEFAAIIVYSDFEELEGENGERKAVPGIKIGDGRTVVGDLPFAAASVAAEVLAMTEAEVRQVLSEGDDQSWSSDVLTEQEVLDILESDEQSAAGDSSSDVLTEDEVLSILDAE